jgi:hypothetical protein
LLHINLNMEEFFIKSQRFKNAKDLKEELPLYPKIRREEKDKVIRFKTLVRKKYEGIYYLIPIEVKEKEGDNAKLVHLLHSVVYKYLMLGKFHFLDTQDNDQTSEIERLLKQ